jgi:excisionase family DNA binding protein
MTELLTPKEVADALSVQLPTVYRYITNGDLIAKRVGPKLLRIEKSELNRFMKGQN